MGSILDDSAASMEGAAEQPQTQQARRVWWASRLSLDQRLGELLERLHTCLGPWR